MYYKERLLALSDALLAIIATILIIEIKLPTSNSYHDIMDFGFDILLFIVSFMSVLNYWFQHTHILKHTESISKKMLIFDIVIHAFVCLTPLLMKWVIVSHGVVSDVTYLTNQFIVSLLLFTFFNIILKKETGKSRKLIRPLLVMLAVFTIAILLVIFMPVLSRLVIVLIPIIQLSSHLKQ